jgi:flavin-dependent dehydrogenase
MALEDYLEPEIAVTAAVVAAIFSPGARRLIRRGAVYGMAGVLIAGDAVTSMAKSVGHGMQQAGAAAAEATQNAANQAKEKAAATANTATSENEVANARTKKATPKVQNTVDQSNTSPDEPGGHFS